MNTRRSLLTSAAMAVPAVLLAKPSYGKGGEEPVNVKPRSKDGMVMYDTNSHYISPSPYFISSVHKFGYEVAIGRKIDSNVEMCSGWKSEGIYGYLQRAGWTATLVIKQYKPSDVVVRYWLTEERSVVYHDGLWIEFPADATLRLQKCDPGMLIGL